MSTLLESGFATLNTADLADALGTRAHVAHVMFQNFGGRRAFRGRVSTVRCYEDSSRVRDVLATSGRGRVLVVDGGASPRCALFGDRSAALAQRNGWEGVVIYGFLRDAVALAALDVGAKALGVVPRKSNWRGEGVAGEPIEIAGVVCAQDDWIVADDDGVVVVRADHLATVEA